MPRRTAIVGRVPCPRCGAEPLNPEARFCSKCGVTLPRRRSRTVAIARLIAFPFVLFLRVLAWPIERRRERLRWLSEASGPDSVAAQTEALLSPRSSGGEIGAGAEGAACSGHDDHAQC
jgi:ribosomal protein L37E